VVHLTLRKLPEKRSDCPIEIIDPKFNSAGLGLVVLAAARTAQSGGSLSEVADEARKAVSHVRMFGMFETMKYLARSGRVNKTIVAASNVLNVMPLLTFNDGEIVRAGLVRRIDKGIERIINFVKTHLPLEEMIIVHSAAEDQAIKLKDKFCEFVESNKISIAELGVGLGVHGGPGVLLTAIRRSDLT
jgi:DegV family protein with EDD domain